MEQEVLGDGVFVIDHVLSFLHQYPSRATPPRNSNKHTARQQRRATKALQAKPISVSNNGARQRVANQDSKRGTECIHSQSPAHGSHVIRDADHS